MAAPNPMLSTYPQSSRNVSSRKHTIAGIITTVYGLDELPSGVNQIVCLWLLHPRLQTQSCMEPLAASTVHAWNSELQKMAGPSRTSGLIAISFDQRNHGSREIDALANEAWRSGNPSHAQDMLGIYRSKAVPMCEIACADNVQMVLQQMYPT